eukprot:TRINITY_DN1845_c0_g1_i1.p1 TRINITY_DN1845_c0_g1~~TRINITY_DN1845_c0_g1_i1.p1  ORF type:complete len:366 (-),score=63.73 TRINITY_DN1845_c0_g1_i1:110-1207(-)
MMINRVACVTTRGAANIKLPLCWVQQRKLHLSNGKRTPATGMVATVFGATGFAGRYVVQTLARVGCQVIVPFRGEESSYTHLKVLGDLGQIVPVRYSLRDPSSIQRTLAYSNIAVNLLGRWWETRNFSYDDVHWKAASDIAQAASEVERFIHVSASCVSTDSPSPWARSKAYGETAVRKILPNATILKPTVLFGDEDRFLNKWARISRDYPFIPLVNPDNLIQPLYVMDLAKSILAALGDEATIGKTYELGGPKYYTWEELLSMITYTARSEKKVFVVPQAALMAAARFIELGRKPLFIRGEIPHWNQDVVTPKDSLNPLDLQIKPTPIDSSLMRICRMYRPPLIYDEPEEISIHKFETGKNAYV